MHVKIWYLQKCPFCHFRAHDLTLHCLYFALQKCSTDVVTDFLPLIEVRIGVWKPYMERLCDRGNDNNSNNQMPQQHRSESEMHLETTTNAERLASSNIGTKSPKPSAAQNKLDFPQDASPKIKTDLKDASSEAKLSTEHKTFKLPPTKSFKLIEESSLENNQNIQIDCSLEDNLLSPQCAHVAHLLSSSSTKPLQTFAMFISVVLVAIWHPL